MSALPTPMPLQEPTGIQPVRLESGSAAPPLRTRRVPSPRWIRLLAVSGLFWLPAIALPAWSLVAAPLVGTLLAASILLEARRLPQASDIGLRRLHPTRFSLGDIQSMSLFLENRFRLPLLYELRDEASTALEILDPLPSGRIEPGETLEIAYRVKAAKRGEHSMGNVLMRLQRPGGFLQLRVAYGASQALRIYPKFTEVSQYHLLAKIDERDDVVRRPRRMRGTGSDFESLRHYVPGDDWRKIDWKASARHSRLITRLFQVEKGQQIAILIDCGRLMSERIGPFLRLDHAFNAAVMVSYVAQQRGDSVSLATFSNRIESFLPPTRGHAVLPSVLDSLYRVQVRDVESDYWQVTAEVMSLLRKRSLVLMLTDVLDSVSSSGLANNLLRAARRHVVLCVVLTEPGIDREADAVPQDEGQLFRKAAAGHLRLERQLALEKMRRQGIHVLETSPENLSIQLVRRYLEIRRSDLL